MNTNSFFKQILFLVVIMLFASCDKDYNEIGADLISQNNFEYKNYQSNVLAYNQEIGPIASNNLPVNQLGIYNDPAFGETIANFATQVQLASLNPIIDPALNQKIKNVILNIPYFVDASKTTALTTGGNSYVLDSIYGNNDSNPKIKLGVYESGYYMGDRDPDDSFTSQQRFYTNQNSDFDGNKKGNRLNDSTSVVQNISFLAQNDEFFFDKNQIVTSTKNESNNETKTYAPPAMRLNLNKEFFLNKILKAPSSKLATNDVFKEYFRGLYFKVEKFAGSDGALNMIDFSKGTITINYIEDKFTTTTKDGATTTEKTRVDKSIVLNLVGNTVSLLEQSNKKSAYDTALNTANKIIGDNNLYLKGGQGSMAVIKLFDKPGELEELRANSWLVNEANLKFYIDDAKMTTSNNPQRIYLYDLTNNVFIADYDFTQTSKNGNVFYDGRIAKEMIENKEVQYYKIRLTNHIKSLIKKDSKLENVTLGVVVTEDIRNYNSSKLESQAGTIKQAPQASVMSPLGTILYGGSPSVPEAKRLKLEINYTKPN